MFNIIYLKDLKTVTEAYDTDVTLANNVIFGACNEVMTLYKIVRNTAMKHNLFNEQEWLSFETNMSLLTSEDPNVKSEF